MLASEILQNRHRPVVTIAESRTVLEAVRLLVEKKIGSLLVTGDSPQIIGIFTERDILKISVNRGHQLGEIKVREVMTKKLIIGEPTHTVNELLGIMTRHHVRHLPIMQGGKLEGLVSIGDLVKAQLDEIEDENRHLKNYIQGTA